MLPIRSPDRSSVTVHAGADEPALRRAAQLPDPMSCWFMVIANRVWRWKNPRKKGKTKKVEKIIIMEKGKDNDEKKKRKKD